MSMWKENRIDFSAWRDSPPIARNTDPQTSHKAAERHTLGKRAIRQQQVFDLVSSYPGKTSGELSRLMVQSYPELPIRSAVESPHKRLSDLEEKGLVVRGRERKCSDSGFQAITWWPVL